MIPKAFQKSENPLTIQVYLFNKSFNYIKKSLGSIIESDVWDEEYETSSYNYFTSFPEVVYTIFVKTNFEVFQKFFLIHMTF